MLFIQEFYATHPFATSLLITSLLALVSLKILSLTSKSVLFFSVLGIAYYFLAISPTQQMELNNKAKVVLEPILGKIEKYQEETLNDVVKDNIEKKYNEVVGN